MRGYSHGTVSSFLLVCFILIGVSMLFEKRTDKANSYEAE